MIGFPILAALVILGGLWLKAGLLLLGILGMYEFYKAASGKFKPLHIAGFVFAAAYIFVENMPFTAMLLILVILLLCAATFLHETVTVRDCADVVFGFLYVALPFFCVYLIRESESGIYFVWLVFTCAFGSDMGGYFTGRLIGKHKLAPTISPHKTVEGSIGGVVLSAALAVALAFIISDFPVAFSPLKFAVIGAVGGAFSQVGDLAASVIKRRAGLKDFGNILPGHGGILDRFDSVLFTAAFVYFCVTAGIL